MKNDGDASVQETSTKKHKTGLIIGIIFALLFICSLCGVGGYFLYKYLIAGSDEETEDSIEDEGESLSDEENCEILWWYDDMSTECKQKEFCGRYMYESLHTFDAQNECEESFGEEEIKSVKVGYISGSVGYPSEYIPEDMEVCVENVSTSEEFCETISKGDNYTYGWGYIIEVPYGDYYVYSQIPGDDYKAYYSQFVTCGMNVDCLSHDPIPITVDDVDTEVTGVDPVDWYNN